MQENLPSDDRGQEIAGTIKHQVRKVIIDSERAGQRIDNFLRGELPGVPKGRVYRMVRKGEVRVNGGRIKAEYKLKEGDEVRIPPAHIRIAGIPPSEKIFTNILDQVIYEDKRLLVLNKPTGIAVHGGSGISHGVIESLRYARVDLKDLALVHRIDRETSGCLIIAKKRSVLRNLHELFRQSKVEKNYLALVVGDWQLGNQLIDAPLHIHNRQNGERHVVVNGSLGKQAQTKVSLSKRYGKYSLLQCVPITGRTHQIRAHLEHAEFPILGDQRYGDDDANAISRRLGLKRLFLHAQSISFVDDTGKDFHFTAPLPEDLERFLSFMTPKSTKKKNSD